MNLYFIFRHFFPLTPPPLRLFGPRAYQIFKILIPSPPTIQTLPVYQALQNTLPGAGIPGGARAFQKAAITKNFAGKTEIMKNIVGKTEIKTACSNKIREKYLRQKGNGEKYLRQKRNGEIHRRQNGNRDGNRQRKFKSRTYNVIVPNICITLWMHQCIKSMYLD